MQVTIMARRRPIYRKPERPTSRKGLLLCLLLAGIVLLVPISGEFRNAAKAKLRDAVLTSGIISLDACVVTATQALACTIGAVGTPLPVALRQMAEQQAQSAEDARHRAEAEAALRTLTAEVDRLNRETEQRRLAARTEGFLPSVVTTVTRTGTEPIEATSLPIQVMPNPTAEPADPELYEPVAEE